MLSKIISLSLIPMCLFGAFDPDTWFALYDDPYITSMEIMGHRYIVQIVCHDSRCNCFDTSDYPDEEDIYGDE
jgi:hypothetical protein